MNLRSHLERGLTYISLDTINWPKSETFADLCRELVIAGTQAKAPLVGRSIPKIREERRRHTVEAFEGFGEFLARNNVDVRDGLLRIVAIGKRNDDEVHRRLS